MRSTPCKQCHDTSHPAAWTAADGFGSDSCRLRWYENRVLVLETTLRGLITDIEPSSERFITTAIECARKVLS